VAAALTGLRSMLRDAEPPDPRSCLDAARGADPASTPANRGTWTEPEASGSPRTEPATAHPWLVLAAVDEGKRPRAVCSTRAVAALSARGRTVDIAHSTLF
jgi:hypothetical protein